MLEEQADIKVPPDDGSITQALTELDAKVAAWVAVMRAAEESLAKVSAGNRRRTKTADRSEKDCPAPGDTGSETLLDTAALTVDSDDVDAEPTSSGSDLALALAQSETETAEDVKVQAEAETAEEIKPAHGPIKATITEQVVEKEIVESEVAPDPGRDGNEEEDATLLASLDPETAKAVRVMRRLAPVQKSVRELISEYEANKAQEQVVQPQKKSWFLRRK